MSSKQIAPLVLSGNDRKLAIAGYRMSRAERAVELAAKRVAKDGKGWIEDLRMHVENNDEDAQRVMRHTFQIGKLMDRLNAKADNADPFDVSGVTDEAWEAARIVFYSDPYQDGTKGKPGKPRRTKSQQTAYETARKGWTRFRELMGIKSLDPRGGAREKPEAETETETETETTKPETTKPQEELVPLVKSSADVAKWLREQSGVMVSFLSRAALDGGVTVPDNIKTLVDAFRRDIDAAIKANKANK